MTLRHLRSRFRGVRPAAAAVVLALLVQGPGGGADLPDGSQVGGGLSGGVAAPRAVPPAPDGTAWGAVPNLPGEGGEREFRPDAGGAGRGSPAARVDSDLSLAWGHRAERPAHLPSQARLRAGSSRWATTLPPPRTAPRSVRRD